MSMDLLKQTIMHIHSARDGSSECKCIYYYIIA